MHSHQPPHHMMCSEKVIFSPWEDWPRNTRKLWLTAVVLRTCLKSLWGTLELFFRIPIEIRKLTSKLWECPFANNTIVPILPETVSSGNLSRPFRVKEPDRCIFSILSLQMKQQYLLCFIGKGKTLLLKVFFRQISRNSSVSPLANNTPWLYRVVTHRGVGNCKWI